MAKSPEDILAFWFYEVGPTRWFKNDPALDEKIRAQFMEEYEAAVRGDLKKWEETPESAIGLLLLLSEFPRRMFRGTARAYENDEIAIDLARTSIIKHFDDRIDRSYKLFFYLPFQYSEHIGDQRLAVYYIRERTKEEPWIATAEESLEVITCFGRFPNRNEALGRETTPDEQTYLKQAANVG